MDHARTTWAYIWSYASHDRKPSPRTPENLHTQSRTQARECSTVVRAEQVHRELTPFGTHVLLVFRQPRQVDYWRQNMRRQLMTQPYQHGAYSE